MTINSRSPSRPTSWMVTMPGWFRLAACRASVAMAPARARAVLPKERETLLSHRHRQAIASTRTRWASHSVPKLDRVLNGDGWLILEPQHQLQAVKYFRAVWIGRVEHPQQNAGVEKATHQS